MRILAIFLRQDLKAIEIDERVTDNQNVWSEVGGLSATGSRQADGCQRLKQRLTMLDQAIRRNFLACPFRRVNRNVEPFFLVKRASEMVAVGQEHRADAVIAHHPLNGLFLETHRVDQYEPIRGADRRAAAIRFIPIVNACQMKRSSVTAISGDWVLHRRGANGFSRSGSTISGATRFNFANLPTLSRIDVIIKHELFELTCR
jgi:hypothetical protein